jgi:hypothetical protein
MANLCNCDRSQTNTPLSHQFCYDCGAGDAETRSVCNACKWCFDCRSLRICQHPHCTNQISHFCAGCLDGTFCADHAGNGTSAWSSHIACSECGQGGLCTQCLPWVPIHKANPNKWHMATRANPYGYNNRVCDDCSGKYK